METKKTLTISFEKDHYDRFETLCNIEKRSQNNMASVLINDAIERKAEGQMPVTNKNRELTNV